MSAAGRLPANWPDGVNYVSACVFDRRVPKAAFGAVTGAPAAPKRKCPPVASAGDVVKIKLITDKAHPACGQRGLIAARVIPKRSHIVDYVGFVTTDEFCSKTSEYTLRLTDNLSGRLVCGVGFPKTVDPPFSQPTSVVDAEKFGNEARFVNDFRGTGAARPNVEFRLVDDGGTRHMAIYALAADIRASGLSGVGACRRSFTNPTLAFFSQGHRASDQLWQGLLAGLPGTPR